MKLLLSLFCFATAFLLAACNTEPIKGPSAKMHCPEPLSIKAYTAAELAPFQSNIEASDEVLSTLFRMSRSALVNADCFKSVNGLRRYPAYDASTEKILLITPVLTQLDNEEGHSSLKVCYYFKDKASLTSVGTLELTAEGGEAGMSAAFQRLILAFQDNVRLSVLGF